MPTDTRNRTSPLSYENNTFSYWTNSWGNPQNGSAQAFTDYDSRTYVQARRRGKGFVNPKPYQRTLVTGNNLSCRAWISGYSTAGFYKYCTLFQPGSYFAIGPSFDGGLVSKAIIDAKLKVKDQSVNYAVALAESKRTGELVGSSAKRLAKSGFSLGKGFADMRKTGFLVAAKATTIAKAAIAVKHGKFQKAAGILGIKRPSKLPLSSRKSRQNLQRVGQNWLEFQYGWKPLMSDVFGSMEHLAKRNTLPQRFGCTVKSLKSAEGKVNRSDGTTGINGVPVETVAFVDWQQSVFARFDYALKHGNMAELAKTGATNPLEIAWELVPFSFVIDWFAPIGKYLQLLDAESGWEFTCGTLTKRHIEEHNLYIRPRPISGWSGISATGVAKYRTKSVVRDVYSSSPIPGFSFKSPVSPVHLANALALVGSAFNTRYR